MVNKLVVIVVIFFLSSCASAPPQQPEPSSTISVSSEPVVNEVEEIWSIVVSRFTGKFVFTISSEGSFTGVSHWSGGSGGKINKISGTIKNNMFDMTRYLAGSHVGKTQHWTGVIDPGAKTVSGVCEGFGCRTTPWRATIN